MDAIVHVVRCFEDDNVIHVDGSVNHLHDKEIVSLNWFSKIWKRWRSAWINFRRSAKTGNKDDARDLETVEKLLKHLEGEKPARSAELRDDEKPFFDELFLLTGKPIFYVCNVDEAALATGNQHTEAFKKAIAAENAEIILISAQIEAEIAELESKEERQEFIQAMGLDEAGVDKVIRACYNLLNLITYFTAGEKEDTRVDDSSGRRSTAGVIHTDFRKDSSARKW